jgi:hypothetical protein
MKLRSLVWHRDQFRHLNEEALDPVAITEAAARVGLRPTGTGLFDIPPFPDTSVPLAKGLRRILGSRRESGPAAANSPAAWRWSILPHLDGDDPELGDRVERLTAFERHLPAVIAPHLAHHRYILFMPQAAASPEQIGFGSALSEAAVPS